MREFFSDLACDDEVSIDGVKRTQYSISGVKISKTIVHSFAAHCVGRRAGSYYAIDNVFRYDNCHLKRAIASILTRYLEGASKVLVIGFGNENYMCDKLGEMTLDRIDKTAMCGNVALLAPSVASVTGISSYDMVKGVIGQYKPSHILAVDTLATSNISRLACSIQLTDAGINPGAGVGDAQNIFSTTSMGIPLIGIGVPLVIATRVITDKECTIDFLTPSLIDGILYDYAKILGDGINMAFHSI